METNMFFPYNSTLSIHSEDTKLYWFKTNIWTLNYYNIRM